MGSVEQAGDFISEFAAVEANLYTPMLRIGDTGNDASRDRNELADLRKHQPRIPEVLERISEYPAVARGDFREEAVVGGLDVEAYCCFAVPLCERHVLGSDIDAGVAAARVYLLVFPCEGARTAADLDHIPFVFRDQPQQVGIVLLRRRCPRKGIQEDKRELPLHRPKNRRTQV